MKFARLCSLVLLCTLPIGCFNKLLKNNLDNAGIDPHHLLKENVESAGPELGRLVEDLATPQLAKHVHRWTVYAMDLPLFTDFGGCNTSPCFTTAGHVTRERGETYEATEMRR